MNWTIAKIAAAGVLTAIPIAVVAAPAYAITSSGGAPIVLPAPPPADPPADPPAPPAQHGEYYNPSDYNDYYYNGSADGGGGGGGG